MNYDSSYRLKATEDSGVEDDDSQSKDNQKIEKGPPVNNAKILLVYEC